MTTCDYAVIGGGIVGLSTAVQLALQYPHARILMLEKEASPAQHQTGRNSGVIHSGIYYKPGSYKARFAGAGSSSMVNFCREHDIPHEICGKVIVATQEKERQGLDNLFQRGRQNGLPVRKISPQELNEIEPHVRCVAGIHVPTTGITNYRKVSQKYLELFLERGGQVMFENEVRQITDRGRTHLIEKDIDLSGSESRLSVSGCALYQDDRRFGALRSERGAGFQARGL